MKKRRLHKFVDFFHRNTFLDKPLRFLRRHYNKKQITLSKYIVYVHYEKKLIYFKLPKTGSNSVRRVLRNCGFIPVKYCNLSSDFLKRCFKFCFYRNPEERLYSGYKDKVRWPGSYEVLSSTPKIKENMSYEEFKEVINSIPEEQRDAHFKSQQVFIKDKEGNWLVNKIYPFEHLNYYVTKLLSTYGIKVDEIPKINQNKK